MNSLPSAPDAQKQPPRPISLSRILLGDCIRVNDRVLFAAGYPRTTQQLRANGFHPLLLNMSEFQKMDGGLSCLSLLDPPLRTSHRSKSAARAIASQ